MQRPRVIFACAVAAVLIAAGAVAAPNLVTIKSSPLQINVAGDASFQIFNAVVPGFGQIFPTGSEYGDFGVFAWIDGALYAPSFATHTGTATGNLGTYTPWTALALTQVTGDGSPTNPYTATASLAATGTDVRVNVTVSHVRGNNFFRLRTHFFSTAAHTINAFVGADIYLAGSDNGIFVTVPELNAVGGRNCDAAEGEYNILLIPITPASRFTTGSYSDVWSQIGDGDLNNAGTAGACIDNGAAVQWNDIMHDSRSVELNTAVSFGEVPSAANFFGFFVDVTPRTIAIAPGQSATLNVNVTHNAELGFNAPVTLSAPNLPPGMNITLARTSFPAPGDGTTTATLTIDGSIFPQFYRSVGIFGSGGSESHGGFVSVDVLCNPPVILGLATSQPQSQTVKRGTTATLTVKPESAGATYQWYSGYAPLTFSPIAGATSASFTTPAVNEQQQYWVRVTNPCGTADSQTAIVSPGN
jgi:hypothetical protein